MVRIGKLDLLRLVRRAAAGRILILPHAAEQMMRPDRMIAPEEVRAVVTGGSIIEEYPEDARGPCCLMSGLAACSGRFLHVVCVPREDFLAVVTAYLPDPDQWSSDFRKRKKR